MIKIIILLCLCFLFLFNCTIELTEIFEVIGKQYHPPEKGFWNDTPERYWVFVLNNKSDIAYKWDNFAAFSILENGDMVKIYRKGRKDYMNLEILYHVKSWAIIN